MIYPKLLIQLICDRRNHIVWFLFVLFSFVSYVAQHTHNMKMKIFYLLFVRFSFSVFCKILVEMVEHQLYSILQFWAVTELAKTVVTLEKHISGDLAWWWQLEESKSENLKGQSWMGQSQWTKSIADVHLLKMVFTMWALQ